MRPVLGFLNTVPISNDLRILNYIKRHWLGRHIPDAPKRTRLPKNIEYQHQGIIDRVIDVGFTRGADRLSPRAPFLIPRRIYRQARNDGLLLLAFKLADNCHVAPRKPGNGLLHNFPVSDLLEAQDVRIELPEVSFGCR